MLMSKKYNGMAHSLQDILLLLCSRGSRKGFLFDVNKIEGVVEVMWSKQVVYFKGITEKVSC